MFFLNSIGRQATTRHEKAGAGSRSDGARCIHQNRNDGRWNRFARFIRCFFLPYSGSAILIN
jgi:hypothetical protein